MRELLSRLAHRSRSPDAEQASSGTAAGPAPPGDPPGTSRRLLITRGFLLFAGALGAGAAGSTLLSGTRAQTLALPVSAASALTPGQPSSASPATLTLHVRDVRFTSPDLKPGALPDSGVLVSPHGELLDDGGAVVGRLSGGVLPGSGGQIAVQRFELNDGVLIGMGSGRLDGAEYSLVGGTGRYAGAIGSYTTGIEPGERGRDAEFVISLMDMRR
jgi:hypothetical protein